MRVVKAAPPNFQKIVATLPEAAGHGVIFAYGDTIFNPSGVPLTHALVKHEEVHEQQQKAHPGGVEGWWDDYLADPVFRLQQEVPAHIVEYLTATAGGSRNMRRIMRNKIAQRLASALYGKRMHIVEAMNILRDAEKAVRKSWESVREAA